MVVRLALAASLRIRHGRAPSAAVLKSQQTYWTLKKTFTERREPGTRGVG
jgi:hypothetical protein